MASTEADVDSKEKVTLAAEQETLLIPLYSKAHESNVFFADEKAREILGRIEYDFAQLKIPQKTLSTLCIRAKRLDAYTEEFLAAHPDGVVIHLGCGLDSRCLRVKARAARWYDLDLPDVIALRRKFYPEAGGYQMLACSVTDLRWIDSTAAQGRPVLVIAEGLLMYLSEAEVRALILKLKEAFPGCCLAFDAYSTLTARSAKGHPSLKKTGAVIRWGVDDPKSLEQWADGIRLREEWFFTQSEDLAKLGAFGRLFKVAGLFSAARRAHRLLYYCL
jgi:O-methyltransferase involved in polyketide biosynthesis